MGKQLSFTEENVKKNPFDYPKLKLAKGESARLTVVEGAFSEYVHNIQKPMLDERNNVLFSTREKKDGTEYQTPKLTFVSNPICLGNEDVLDEDGLDPENCPVCAKAISSGESHWKPKRRFAMHVIRTATQPRSNTPVEPYSGQLLIWAFTENRFTEIFEVGNEFGLDTHDLILGPCEDATFQKAKLTIANGTAVSPETRAAIFTDKNKAEDPTVFCGNRKSRARIEDDLALVEAEWAKAEGTEPTSTASVASLSEGIGALLSDDAPAAPVVAEKKEEVEAVASFDDLPETKAPEKAPAKAKAAPKETGLDLDDILGNL